MNKKEVNQYSPLTLAFLGDAVYELRVRERIVSGANMPVGKLHKEAVKRVRAEYQAKAVELIAPMLTEEEAAVLKRGRNACPNTVPKNADLAEYRRATALETLFGYLYLLEENERIAELFEYIWEGDF
ncbi:MAG: ribonuclease III [Oscillospiraceae bacterium]|nr:ribonuclease III [Oscillospiraceae bacterium]